MSFQNTGSNNNKNRLTWGQQNPRERGESFSKNPPSSGPQLPEILFITTFPPRECGIANYSQDLLEAIEDKFGASFSLKVCALEAAGEFLDYPENVKYVLPSSELWAYEDLAAKLNLDDNLCMIFVQHEFGLFGGEYGQYLLGLLCAVNKPVITTFHTILPTPDESRKNIVKAIVENSVEVVVMTATGGKILENDYDVPSEKIAHIAHGTHLVAFSDQTGNTALNELGDRKILTTFGLLSPGKSIETALEALPAIINKFPNVLYLIIGKTHPGVSKHDGERYRQMLEQMVLNLNLQDHVRFINKYLSLPDLLAYLQRADIYLFTSKDPRQVVSGTFAYAMGCGCPVISTPIPHAKEQLRGGGTIVDFQSPGQLAEATIRLLSNPSLMNEMKLNAFHQIRPTAWPNAALAHVELVTKFNSREQTVIHYSLPPMVLSHIRRLTTSKGMIQFSKLSAPSISSGYTLDDNARALIAMCRYYKATKDASVLPLIETYLDFVIRCQRPDGSFLNYVAEDGTFTEQNSLENLEDSNGRAVWALGEFIALCNRLDIQWKKKAELAFLKSLLYVVKMKSPRAMSFVIKGLHHYNLVRRSAIVEQQIILLANDLVAKHSDVSDAKWQWFEEYMTYANGVIPEALLCAYLSTGDETYKGIAKRCFDFLLSIIIQNDEIKVVSNQGWLSKGNNPNRYGEQPIDVAYTVMALGKFHEVFPYEGYREKMQMSFNWFLGKNHLRQIMYDPITGGCYDGLEEHHINLNQGAESTVSYLLSRLVMDENFYDSHSDNEALTEPLPVSSPC